MWTMKCVNALYLYNIGDKCIEKDNMSDNVCIIVSNSIRNIVYRVVVKTPISDSYVGDLSKIKDILHNV